MVVGGEQRARAGSPGDVFHRSPGDGEPVERGRPPPHFVQYEQAARRGEFEDIRHLRHLHHEGGLAAIEVVGSADAREDAVGQGDVRRGRGHKAANMRHQRDQRHLAHVGGLARHIRPGDDHHAVFAVEMGVVGHEHRAPQPLFDHRMPPLHDLIAPFVVDRGAHVLVFLRHKRKREQNVERLERPGRGAQARQGLFQRFADLAKKLIFQVYGVFLRAEDLAFQLLQFLGDEALAVCQRLLAGIAVRDEIVKRARDFYVIAKDAIVADLQVLDARGFPFALLQFGQIGLAIVGDVAQLVQLRVVTVADHAAFAHGERRVVVDGAGKQRAYVIHRVERLRAALDERRIAGGGILPDQRHHLQGRAQGDAIAGVERVIGDAAQQAFDVVNAAERLAQRVGLEKTLCEALHGVQTRFDLPRVTERALDPVAQKPPAHRRLRAIEDTEQGAALAASVRRLRQFQALQRRTVERHKARSLVGTQLDDVRKRVFLRLRQVGKQRARRADAQPLVVQTKVGNAFSEVRAQAFCGARVFKARLIRRPGALGAFRRAGGQRRPVVDDDLARLDARQFVGQRKTHITERKIAEFSRGNVGKGHARALLPRADAQKIARARVFEHARFDDRAGRDHADDLALDQPLGGGGIAHLLADGHLVALLDQPREICVHRVKGHAAHRRALRQTAVFSCQRQFQLPGDEDGVLKEHLVEVSQPEKEDRVLILLLDAEVLLHHRRDRHRHHPLSYPKPLIRHAAGTAARRAAAGTLALAGHLACDDELQDLVDLVDEL